MMNPEIQALEAQLLCLKPAALSQDFEQRCLAALTQTLEDISLVQQRTAQHAEQAHPGALPAHLLRKLEACVANTPFPLDDNVVLFTRGNAQATAPAAKRRKFSRAQLSAAAAALVVGISSAFLIPFSPAPSANLAAQPKVTTTAPQIDTVHNAKQTGGLVASNAVANPAASHVIPASYGNNIQEATDEGVVWQGNTARRMLRVVYKQKVSYINPQGQKVEYERPRVEYILAPEKIN